jgi:hypothetical protein
MREIKFRGKNIETGEWLYGNLQVPSKEGVPYFMWDERKYQCKVDPETIGEFTSLKDKNGKEIYEGDILSFDYGVSEPVSEYLIEVRFVRGVFAFLWNGNLDNECPTGSPTHEWATVVGNIHDNPDLIKNN